MKERFKRVYRQGTSLSGQAEVWVDRTTGVNYLFLKSGYGGGLAPLLGPDGRPVVTPLGPEMD